VRQALAAGHAVDVAARGASAAIPTGATLVTCDVLDPLAVSASVKADHSVIVTLGGTDAITKGCANVIAAATAAGAKRLLGVVGAGVLQADAKRLRNELPDYPPPLRTIGAAHHAFYESLRASL